MEGRRSEHACLGESFARELSRAPVDLTYTAGRFGGGEIPGE